MLSVQQLDTSCAAALRRRQRVGEVDADLQPLGTDGDLLHFPGGCDPPLRQQPPQRQLRQQLRCAHHPECGLLIDIEGCCVFCRYGGFGAVRQGYGLKSGGCAEAVVDLHGDISFLRAGAFFYTSWNDDMFFHGLIFV